MNSCTRRSRAQTSTRSMNAESDNEEDVFPRRPNRRSVINGGDTPVRVGHERTIAKQSKIRKSGERTALLSTTATATTTTTTTTTAPLTLSNSARLASKSTRSQSSNGNGVPEIADLDFEFSYWVMKERAFSRMQRGTYWTPGGYQTTTCLCDEI
jgi:hypothetical protein